jgi:hypothetical protein
MFGDEFSQEFSGSIARSQLYLKVIPLLRNEYRHAVSPQL